MKKIFVMILITAVMFIAIPTICFAGLDPKAEVSSVVDTFLASIGDIEASLKAHGERLFILLAIIQFMYAMGTLVVRGQIDMQAIATTLLRQIMLVGIFFFLIHNGTAIFQAIIDSFRMAATSSGKISDSINPGEMLSAGLKLTEALKTKAWEYSGFFSSLGYGEYIYIAIVCIILQMAFAVISVTYMLALIKGYFICTAGMLFLGFGGSEWSSDIAKNTLKSVLSVGAEIFCVLLIATIVTNALSDWANQINNATDGETISTLVGVTGSMAFIIAVLTLTVPSLASGLISGAAIGGGRTAGTGAMAGAAAMTPVSMMARAGMSKAGKAVGSKVAGGVKSGASKMWKNATQPMTVARSLGKSSGSGGNSVAP